MAQKTADNNRPYDYTTMDDVIADITELYSQISTTPSSNTKVFVGNLLVEIDEEDTALSSINSLVNTTGFEPSSTVESAGKYKITFSGLTVDDLKKVYFSLPPFAGEEGVIYTTTSRVDTNGGSLNLYINTFDSDDSGSDFIIQSNAGGLPFKIEIYE